MHFRVNSYYITGNSRCRDQRGVDRFKSLSGKTANPFSVFIKTKKKFKLSEKGDLMVYLKVVRFTAGTFKWNKPAEPEPPTKNSPTRIHNTCIQVYE